MSAARSRCCLSFRPELKEAMDLGITLFAGEAKAVSRICCGPRIAARCNRSTTSMKDLPSLEGRADALPAAPRRGAAHERCGARALDAGRGCRYCAASAPSSTCRAASRAARSADDVEQLVRANLAQGVHNFFITDRQPCAQPELGGDVRPTDPDAARRRPAHHIRRHQVDTMAHRTRLHREGGPGRRQRGCSSCLREHQPRLPEGRAEGQNAHHAVSQMLQAWHRVGRADITRVTCLGFPGGLRAGIDRARHPASSSRSCRSTYSSSSS